MEEVVLPEEAPRLVPATVLDIPEQRWCTAFLRIANESFPLELGASHLKRIRRTSPVDRQLLSLQGIGAAKLCDTSVRAVEDETGNALKPQGRLTVADQTLELLLCLGENTDENALHEFEAFVSSTLSNERVLSVHSVFVPDRVPRTSPDEWRKWNGVWPFAVPKPHPPAPLSDEEVGSIRRVFCEVVMPLAKRSKSAKTLGIAAALVDPFNNWRVVVTSDGAIPLERGNGAACLGYTTADVSGEVGRIVLEHPVTYVLKQLARLQSGDQTECGSSSPYLANNLDLVVSHEPCVMCSMALVHSRVRRVFYCFGNSAHGGLGSVLSIHALPQLNHHFSVFRCKENWLASVDNVRDEFQCVYCEELRVP
ncbi:Cytidine and deoxycytidylate deaminase zinc binding region [Trypanosoma vivax]|uniref:Putative deaminase n=1 Tax=Trypanosoma vivax (strain Y486) TaxID=1055687 RepID=G0U942_TRYVY|nr:putative deaminase [Trypanosoma vivax]KAH8603405.1 Cytidine and deoxycytidylate deaminase zinc binding region [Trypanosoma vivax]CCC54126.1 putative deaminase [Trypanosoma vivax Y486]